MNINEISVIFRLSLATGCGFVLGLERTRKRRPAGLRTYMLVCVGACVTMLTGLFLREYYGASEVARMSAQVVSGIGFLGVGTIMVTRHYRVKGLTTAAGLWCTACLGTAVGAGFYLVSFATCLIMVFIMIFADRFETAYTQRLRWVHLYVILENVDKLRQFISELKARGIALSDVETTKADGGQGVGLFCQLKMPYRMTNDEAMNIVEGCGGVLFAEDIEF
jgi:putative Mg2+ transporter-C (MgtC) family protein